MSKTRDFVIQLPEDLFNDVERGHLSYDLFVVRDGDKKHVVAGAIDLSGNEQQVVSGNGEDLDGI